jgi:hypothetical protein
MNEDQARRLTLVQAFDDAGSPLWTREDAQWATRLAVQTAPAGAAPGRLAVERAGHALQRLAPRDPAIGRWLARSGWRWGALALALAAGFAAGLLADLAGRSGRIDLLAPAAWGVVAWNLAIYAVLALGAMRGGSPAAGGLRRLLAAALQRGFGQGPLREASLRWAALSAPLTASRVAVLVHLAAAALAAGMIAGLYLRGLVFDYRVAWESTFLEAPTLRAMLGVLLAPASALTGVALPDVAAVQAMRLTPENPRAVAPAAGWIHLYAATLVLAVAAPRLLLALAAAVRAAVLAHRLQPPADAAALARFARWHPSGTAPVVQVLPYAQPPGAQAALGLRQLLAGEIGEDLVLKVADVTAIGDEQAVAARVGHAPTVLRAGLVDMAATPEAEHHGRFAEALRQAQPAADTLLLVDEAAFRARFASLPARLEERRAAWQRFAREQGLRLAIVNLDQPERPEGAAALRQVLRG